MTDQVLLVTPAAVLDAVSRAVAATDTDGTVLYWNRAAELLYGWSADEVVGRNIVDVLLPPEAVADLDAVLAQVRAGDEWSGEIPTRHKDGRSLTVAALVRPVFDDQGRVTAIVGESEDPTADHVLQSELRTTRDEQRLALAAGRLGVLRWDRATGRVTLDRTAESLLGLPEGAFPGTFEAWAAMLHPDDRERVCTMLDRAVETNGAYDLEYRVVWPDGSIHWLQGRGQVTVDDEGAVTGRIGCMTDITARRLADEERAHLLAVERSTRTEAETVATRLRGLQAVTASLIRAVDARSVAQAVLTEGVPAVGGRTGSICLVAEDGETVEIVHEVGYRDEVKEHWRTFPLGADLPASDAIRRGEMVLLRGPEDRDARYPVFRGTPMVTDLAVACVPLVDEDGTSFGAMVVGFPEERDFTEPELRLLSALAAQCATALRRAALYEAEREARMAAERAQERLAFLAEASSALASSVLDLDTTLAQVVDLAVPRLADGCAIALVDDRRRSRIVAVSHLDPAKVERLRALVESLGGECRQVMRRETTDEHGGRRLVTVLPLCSQRRVVGALTLVSDGGRPVEDGDVQLGEQLAFRAGAAIESARLFAERSRVARSLQASLLPPSLPAIPGLELGARYAPAGEGVEVGGDFYDAFAVEGGRWLLVVGDVRGKGVDAAAVTGLARHTIRSIAMYESRPSAILAHLNRVLLAAEADRVAAVQAHDEPPWELTEPRFCTVAIAVVEPGPGRACVQICSGGHPLPLVARADGRVEPAGRPGTLIGASTEIELHDVGLEMGPGDALVCFTDGIVERHRGRRFFEDTGIAKVLSEAAGSDAATLAARIEQEARNLFDDNPHDDMAVLVARVPRP
ncbi:MAG TPA: SpoIIE family protein phosphatase [Acidimicrobiales bacterium]|nr:SpoIIE family protein phosphatase [Acidimicrobiales bacterium]